jgi:hypothetical protein
MTSFIDNIKETYHSEGFPLLDTTFSYNGDKPDGTHFDAKKHLQVELPSHVKDMNFNDIEYPFNNEQSKINGQVAYSRPFRILSDEGIKLAREAIDCNHEKLGISCERSAFYLRGLGFVSNWHKEFVDHPEVIQLINSITRDKLTPSSLTRNISHTNIGKVASGKPIDKWHTDSCDYAMVIILSDITDMNGGELRVLQCPDASGGNGTESTFKTLQSNGIPEDLVETIKYTGAGYAIIMQGSKILHSVNEVFSAREPRISLVNSYMTCRSFMPDMTRFSTFVDEDGMDILALEYARGKAWRIKGQMKYILHEANLSNKPQELSVILRTAAQELTKAADLIDLKSHDHPKWNEQYLDAEGRFGSVHHSDQVKRVKRE